MKRIFYISLFLLALGCVASGHSWYPPECCAGTDCFPIDCGKVLPNGDGSYMVEGMLFTKDKIKISMDAMCHYCTPSLPRCLFLPWGA